MGMKIYLHPLTFNILKLQKLLQLPFFPLSPLMLLLILFPSMGIWAMKSRLRYFIQPVKETSFSAQGRTAAYRRAQELREEMQGKLNQLF